MTRRNMPDPGYYDVAVPFWETHCDKFGNPTGPERRVVQHWLGARVLMMDGEDAIVEHHPHGWPPNVLRRIDRVTPGMMATFTPIPSVPTTVGDDHAV